MTSGMGAFGGNSLWTGGLEKDHSPPSRAQMPFRTLELFRKEVQSVGGGVAVGGSM